uniref:Uncharacterized protein n=1 Tax=Nelumbo nucifera TaxID=4432 RepID=A0A822XEV8_NELNU|nr:TPA_asm: hypothetical protein HUJ06_021437 [Nelumbo nucifera]
MDDHGEDRDLNVDQEDSRLFSDRWDDLMRRPDLIAYSGSW